MPGLGVTLNSHEIMDRCVTEQYDNLIWSEARDAAPVILPLDRRGL